MATLTSAGLGSGLDVNSIVTQLMQLERAPLNKIQSQISQANTQISDMGKLKSAVSDLQTAVRGLRSPDVFNVFSAKAGSTEFFSATASSTATAGTYNVVVNTVARTQSLATSQTFGNKTDAQATADTQLAFTVGGEVKTVDISNGASLTDIKDEVNQADIGVSATIVNTGTSAVPAYKLVFMTTESGTASQISQIEASVAGDTANNGGLDFVEFGLTQPDPPADQLPLMETKQAASDASVTINGITVSSASNSITDALEGVTINVSKEGSSSLTVGRDQEKINEKLQGFVDAYNKVYTTSKNLRAGSLKGDSTMLSVQSQLASVLQTPSGSQAGSSYEYLSQIGISIQKDGTLALDKSKFETAMNANSVNVRSLFGNDADDGFMDRFNSVTTKMLDPEGLLSTRTKGLQDRVKVYQRSADTMELRLELREATLRAQYTALDSTVARMKNTSSYLMAQLGATG